MRRPVEAAAAEAEAAELAAGADLIAGMAIVVTGPCKILFVLNIDGKLNGDTTLLAIELSGFVADVRTGIDMIGV